MKSAQDKGPGVRHTWEWRGVTCLLAHPLPHLVHSPGPRRQQEGKKGGGGNQTVILWVWWVV